MNMTDWTETELSALRRAYDKQLAIYKADLAAATAALAIGAAKRDESLDAAEHAALSTVCLGILNLDEALTREIINAVSFLFAAGLASTFLLHSNRARAAAIARGALKSSR